MFTNLFPLSVVDIVQIVLCIILIVVIIDTIKQYRYHKEILKIAKNVKILNLYMQDLFDGKQYAFYDFSKKIIVDEHGSPIKLSELNIKLTLINFIGNELPSKAIQVSIRDYVPKKYNRSKKGFEIFLQPLSSSNIWKVECNTPDRTIFSHPIMGTLVLNDISSDINTKTKATLYQRVTTIGDDYLVQYELREN